MEKRISLRIPYTAAYSPADALHVWASLGGGPAHMFEVDTGSVGILVPRAVLGPNILAVDPAKGTTFGFVSSGNSYHGEWVKVSVVLGVPEGWDGTGAFATTVVEVFAVDTPATFSHGMLGIGFGIEKAANGGPACNPLLHLSCANEVLAPNYIISHEGIDVGIAGHAPNGFSLVQLQRNLCNDKDWQQPLGTTVLSESFVINQPILMDTGISEMLLFLPEGTRPPDLTCYTALPPRIPVSVSIPDRDGGQALAYAFVTGGDSEPMAPVSVEFRKGHGINTGRNVLAGADYFFDAEAGLMGFRKRPIGPEKTATET
jgi:hypothetical protein